MPYAHSRFSGTIWQYMAACCFCQNAQPVAQKQQVRTTRPLSGIWQTLKTPWSKQTPGLFGRCVLSLSGWHSYLFTAEQSRQTNDNMIQISSSFFGAYSFFGQKRQHRCHGSSVSTAKCCVYISQRTLQEQTVHARHFPSYPRRVDT